MCRKQKGANLSILTGRWSLIENVWYFIVHRLTRKDVAGIHITDRWIRSARPRFLEVYVWIREVHPGSVEEALWIRIEDVLSGNADSCDIKADGLLWNADNYLKNRMYI